MLYNGVMQARMAINPGSVTNNWFLKPINQRRFGNNGKYLLLIGFCINITETTIYFMFILYFKHLFLSVVQLFSSLVIKAIVGMKIWSKFEHFKNYDTLGIYTEIRITFFTYIIIIN